MYWIFSSNLRVAKTFEVVVTGLPEVAALAFEEFGGLAFDDPEGGGE
jgi:hypothetical protein